VNPIENYRFGFEDKWDEKLIDLMENNQTLFARIINDPDFGAYLKGLIMEKVYRKQRVGQSYRLSCLLTRPEVRILRFVATRALGGIATDVHPAYRTRLHLDPAAPGEFSFLFANRGGFHRFLE